MLTPNKPYSLLTMYHNATGSTRKPQTARHCATCARSGGRAGAGPGPARAARSGPAMDIRTSRENPQRRPRGSRRHVWSRRTNEGRQAARVNAPRSDAPQLVGLKLPRIPATAGALDHIGHSVIIFFLPGKIIPECFSVRAAHSAQRSGEKGGRIPPGGEKIFTL